MRVHAGVYTFNHMREPRRDFFHRTLLSLSHGDYPLGITVVTNGSTDGTSDEVRRLGGIVDDTHSQIWYGMELAVNACLSAGADLVILSADDIEYRPGWLRTLVDYWEVAPPEVKIVATVLEPDYPWNTVRGYIDGAGIRGLIRDSAGGSYWSFRAKDWSEIGPLPQKMPGEDLDICRKIYQNGGVLVQADLADHIGERHSNWGNYSWEYARPLDRARWGI